MQSSSDATEGKNGCPIYFVIEPHILPFLPSAISQEKIKCLQ